VDQQQTGKVAAHQQQPLSKAPPLDEEDAVSALSSLAQWVNAVEEDVD